MDEYDRSRLRRVLLLGSIGPAVGAADPDADARVGKSHAYDPAHSNPDTYAYKNPYGQHVTHAHPVPGCNLCDSVAHAYAHGMPERGMDPSQRGDRVEGGRNGDAGLRRGTVGRPAGDNGHRDRDDNEAVQVDGEVK